MTSTNGVNERLVLQELRNYIDKVTQKPSSPFDDAAEGVLFVASVRRK